MEDFKFRVVDSGATPVTVTPPMPQPLLAVTNVAERLSQGHEIAPIGFPGNVPAPVQISSGEGMTRREMDMREEIRREIEKDEIRRQIMAEIAAARRRELEEEVRREIAMEKGLSIPMQRPERLLVPQQVSTFLNPRMNHPVNNINLYGGPQPQIHHEAPVTNNKQKVIILARPDADADVSSVKRKAVTLPAIDDESELSTTSLQKKPKRHWSCELCHVTATSEKTLNDHFRGKKHKAKEASLTTPKIGLDARPPQPQIQTLLPNIIPTEIGLLEPGKEDHAKKQSQGLGDIENESETVAVKKAGQTSAARQEKKFQFWCALCKVQARSEAVMHSHKAGKKHLANMKKASQINSPG